MPALFAVATLAPLVPLILGLTHGGVWVWLAVVSMTVLVGALDLLVRVALPGKPEEVEFPAGDTLSVLIGIAQLALIPFVVVRLAGGDHGAVAKIGLLYTAALWLGQVGNSNAHELIHRPSRSLRRLGTALFVSVLYGHHASAHPKVHHAHVATPDDPATARMGESLYTYFPRCWIGSFRAGHRAERRLLQARHGDRWQRHDPYIAYVGGGLLCIITAMALAGIAGAAWYVALAFLAQLQLLLSDYVQHYGLERRRLPSGKLERVGPAHSWNAPHWYSGAMMLQAPRHSDHHAHPARPFHHLGLPPASVAPRLPSSLPLMAGIALLPHVWRRVMDHRAERWRQAAKPVARQPTDMAGSEHVA
ncbi:alkane 1-monooxygenase [Palleronia sp.]|uniref:alkane 1-monooxygenase n=1 Tax=Palleronia sp. TaxID=1940284 RepID=UPI0035C7BD11